MEKQRNLREYIYSLMNDTETGFIASALKFILLLCSWLYFSGLKSIMFLQQGGIIPTVHLGVRVISVGNLTVGGTGKTPLVEFIVNILSRKGNKVAVLTRGYKIASEKKTELSADRDISLFEQIGDEPALLRMKLPQAAVLVGPDRVKTGQEAIYKHGADVLVLDDGFQYWRLSRDIDILAIDASNPFGNGSLLPRGILREPVEDLVRASIFVLSKADMAKPQALQAIKNRIRSLNPDALIVEAVHEPVQLVEFANSEKLFSEVEHTDLKLDSLKGKPCVSVCGIARPNYFIKTLKDLGADIKNSITFEDHHPYVFSDIENISKACVQAGTNTVVTTEKDMIKFRALIQRHVFSFKSLQLRLLSLGIKLKITQGEDKFIECLTKSCI